MKKKTRNTFAGFAGMIVVAGSLAIAQHQQQPQDSPPEFELPPGWTLQDLQAFIDAATPGDQHEYLRQSTGQWSGTARMWKAPGAEPIEGEFLTIITSLMDGRYTKAEVSGELPGMGRFEGFGLYGYDKVTQRFQSTWIDNHSTTIMNGIGERSPDGETMTWLVSYVCPIRNAPAVMREVERTTGPDTKTMTMFGTDPKTGEEYKMMEIDFTRSRLDR